MKNAPKLTEQEISLIRDAAILQLKSSAITKISGLLSCFQDILRQYIEKNDSLKLFETAFSSSKISRGENYLGLPYLVLDYPASFSHSSIVAFRSFFWWGNFFSFTLHLQGDALEKVRKNLVLQSESLKNSNYFICISDSPWHYHYEKTNYRQSNDFAPGELEELLTAKSFLKISHKISLDEHAKLAELGVQAFETIFSLTRDGN